MSRPAWDVTVTVDVPPEAEAVARVRALNMGEPERWEDYLLDHLSLRLNLQTTESSSTSEFTRGATRIS